MTANLNLMTKYLSPILPLTRAASRVSAVWFEPTFESPWFSLCCPSCILGNLDTTAKWKSGHPSSVEPPGPTGKISRPLFSLQVKSRPNRLGRSKNHPTCTERPDRQLHSWAAMTRYEHFRRPSRYEIMSHPWVRSEDCLYSPFQLYDASLGASAVENGSKTHLYLYLPIRTCLCSRSEQNNNGSNWWRHKKLESLVF